MRLTCRYRFSASHRLHTDSLSEQQNRELYGKCNNPFGHGHNYVLDITVEGPLDATGRVVDPEALGDLVKRQVLTLVEHKNLNQDVAELSGIVPTTENLASLVEGRLLKHWNLAPKLARIRISETERNAFELERG